MEELDRIQNGEDVKKRCQYVNNILYCVNMF